MKVSKLEAFIRAICYPFIATQKFLLRYELTILGILLTVVSYFLAVGATHTSNDLMGIQVWLAFTSFGTLIGGAVLIINGLIKVYEKSRYY